MRLLPDRTDGERSWIVSLAERRRKAAEAAVDGLGIVRQQVPGLGAGLEVFLSQRSHALHRRLRGRLAAAVADLNADRRPLPLHEGDQRSKTLRLRFVPDAEVEFIDQPGLFDAGGLDKDQPKASQGIAAEMHVVKGAAHITGCGAVVDHRRHDQAVLQSEAADLKRLEQHGPCQFDAIGDRG